MATVPTENTIRIIAPTNEYKWDKNGDLTIRNITCDTLWVDGSPMDVPDYVFGRDYSLPSLNDVQDFTEMYGHLPNYTPAHKVGKVNILEKSYKNQEEIEKLYLYIFEMKKEIEILKRQ